MSANTPNYRIVWHIPGNGGYDGPGSPFRATRSDARKIIRRQLIRLAPNFGVTPESITWELEYRLGGIDRWEIVETSQRNAIAHHDNATG